MTLTLAGIDVGTNTLRLLIAEFSPDGNFQNIHASQYITRLGEDISRTGKLKNEAMDRSVEALKKFSEVCSNYKLDGIHAVATSAVREAVNGADFSRMVKSGTGMDLNIISGKEEARLTMLSVFTGLNIEDEDVVVMDIGGGSTEFIFLSGGNISYKTSTDIGVVRFTEEYLHSDPPEKPEIQLLKKAVNERLKRIGDTNPVLFPKKERGRSPRLIGIAGTVTTLAAIDQKMAVYNPDEIHGSRISREDVERILKMLVSMTARERKGVAGIEEGREDLIVAGAIIVDKVMEWYGFREMTVSDYGLREGVVIDLYNRMCSSQGS